MMKASILFLCAFTCTSIRLEKAHKFDDGMDATADETEEGLPGGMSDSYKGELMKTISPMEQTQYLYRRSVLVKLFAIQAKDKRVKIMEPHGFNKLAQNSTAIESLPAEGSIIFVIDDAFHSICESPRADAKFLDNPKILAVASENWMGPSHSKVTNWPIGLESKLMTARKGESPLTTFLNHMQNPIPKAERKHNVTSDAQLRIFTAPKSHYRDDRTSMVKEVQAGAVDDWYKSHVDYGSHFLNHVAQAKLSLCPEGNGMDTHRFYHNYANRVRCIVRKGLLSDLHAQFPGTIVVDAWKEVTKENVQKWLQEDTVYNPDLVTSDYWLNKVLKPFGIVQ